MGTIESLMTADVVSKGELYSVPFGKAVTYKLPSKEMSTIERALYAHHIDHFIDKDLVPKGKDRPTQPEPPPPTAPPEPTLNTEIADAMSAGPGNAPYVNAYSLCRQYPELPECKAFI